MTLVYVQVIAVQAALNMPILTVSFPLLCMTSYLNYCQHRCTAVTVSTEAPPTYYLSLIFARGNKTTTVTSSGRKIHRFKNMEPILLW